MRWIVRAYTLVLLAYTGWRTYDFMMQQLPDDSFNFWLAILFLFATEMGLAIWHEYSISHTTTYTQHYVAVSLTWLDFAGSLGAGIADMVLRQTMLANYQVPESLAVFLIYGLPALVAINIAGALVFLANDAEATIDRERRFIEFEASRQAIRQISSNRRVIASRKRDELYQLMTSGDAPKTNGRVPEEAELLANPTQRRKSGKT